MRITKQGVSKGFAELRPSAYTTSSQEPPRNLHQAPGDKHNVAGYLFIDFERCRYSVQKVHSDNESETARIRHRDREKRFKPARD